MVGVVGKIKICYAILGNQYEEVIDPRTTLNFSLKYCPQIQFRIEEVTYIEDTIYGVTLSLIEPQFRDSEFIVGNGITNFSIEEYGITGYFSLYF